MEEIVVVVDLIGRSIFRIERGNDERASLSFEGETDHAIANNSQTNGKTAEKSLRTKSNRTSHRPSYSVGSLNFRTQHPLRLAHDFLMSRLLIRNRTYFLQPKSFGSERFRRSLCRKRREKRGEILGEGRGCGRERMIPWFVVPARYE